MTVEPPEHRACRTNTNPERRGVEAALNQWRLGDSNWRNLYIGTRHVGVLWEPGLPEQVIAAMNGDPERDERLRAEGRRQADNAITWDVTCIGCAGRLDALIAERHAGAQEAAGWIISEFRTRGVPEAVALVEAYIARGSLSDPETPAVASVGPSEGEPP
jgi:hypothetical protein